MLEANHYGTIHILMLYIFLEENDQYGRFSYNCKKDQLI